MIGKEGKIDNKCMCSLCSLHIDLGFHIHVPGSCKDSSAHSQIVRFNRTGKILRICFVNILCSLPPNHPPTLSVEGPHFEEK